MQIEDLNFEVKELKEKVENIESILAVIHKSIGCIININDEFTRRISTLEDDLSKSVADLDDKIFKITGEQ